MLSSLFLYVFFVCQNFNGAQICLCKLSIKHDTLEQSQTCTRVNAHMQICNEMRAITQQTKTKKQSMHCWFGRPQVTSTICRYLDEKSNTVQVLCWLDGCIPNVIHYSLGPRLHCLELTHHIKTTLAT